MAIAASTQFTKHIGRRLKSARIRAGFKTISSFIEYHKIPRTTYSQYEAGSREFCIKSAVEFCKIFETNLIWLLTGLGKIDITDNDFIELTSEDEYHKNLLSEKEFLQIINQSKEKKTLGGHTIKSKNKSLDPELLSEVLKKVFEILSSINTEINANDLSHLTCSIYEDLIKLDSDNKSSLEVLDILKSAFSRRLGQEKKSSNF